MAAEIDQVRGWLEQILPELALRSETMKRFAESFFVGKPHVEKYMLQLCALPPSPTPASLAPA